MSTDHTIANLAWIKPQDLAPLLRSPETRSTVAIIDARDADYIGGHIAGADNVPVHKHDYRMPELVRTLQNKDTVVFHCMLSQQRGPESALAFLRERDRLNAAGEVGVRKDGMDMRGAQKVFVLDGGFMKWVELYGEDPDLTEDYKAEIWKEE